MKPFIQTIVLFGVVSLAAACNDEPPKTEPTSGGESVLETAEKNIDEAHRDFQAQIKPAADFVDEKANTAVAEGRKAVGKVSDAVSGKDREPEPGKP